MYVVNCQDLNGCTGVVNIDSWNVQNAGTNPASHLNAVPTNGTVVEGVPSDTYWEFDSGLRSQVGPTATATLVSDAGVDAFPEAPSAQGQVPTQGQAPTLGQAPTQGGGSTVAPASTTQAASRERCVVPNLGHRTLQDGRRVLIRAHCELGKIRRPHNTRVRLGRDRRYVLRVVRQSVRVRSVHAQRFRVGVTLGWVRR